MKLGFVADGLRLVLVRVEEVRPPRPICLCGCGEQTEWRRQAKAWSLYRTGHNRRGKRAAHPELAHLTPGTPAYWKAVSAKQPGYGALRSRRWRERNPDGKRWEHLKRYGITQEQYEALLAKQGGCCAICRGADPGRGRTLWCVDHDHESGAVRGLLCFSCNVGLGAFKDDETVLLRAAAYLGGAP